MADRTDAHLPRLAIIGAGPVGLDAALAAAERGWDTTVFEASARPAGNVRSWGHVRLFSPWSMDASPRMRRALADAGREVPDGDDACPTGDELADVVLDPVARLDAVAPGFRLATRVVAVGREGLLKSEEIASDERSRRPFRLLVEPVGGGERRVEHADAVIDASGSLARPQPLGDGGLPALGEERLDGAVVRTLPDLSRAADAWAGKTVLVVGGGHSAQTAVRDLADLAASDGGAGTVGDTRVHWVQRSAGPIAVDPDDPLPARARLGRRAEELASGASDAVTAHRGFVVERLEATDDGTIEVTLRRREGSGDGGGDARTLTVDRILALTGAVGDASLYRQLQVHECYASGAPMKLSAALLGAAGEGGGDCLALGGFGPEVLVNPEPGFFLLGAKSYGNNSNFLLRTGWEQVDDVFSLLDQRFA